MAPNQSQIVFDDWDTYVREREDGIVFISFDVEAASEDLTGTLPHCGRVVIPIHKPGPRGAPEPEEAERLWSLEDELCETLTTFGVVCRMVGRLTHQGLRVLVFQLDNWDSFRPAVLAWAEECEDYEIKLSEGEGWDFFNDCIRPQPQDWLFMADSRVIHSLTEAGTDPEKEHALEFVFQGDPAALDQVRCLLEARNYTSLDGVVSKLEKSDEIILVKKMKLDLRAITSESLRLAQLAEEHGVRYDGWGAAVMQ